ncbi:MAG: hypothetical protein MHM6MM_000144 [Cercozoa sp. M6MM]
MPKEDLPPRRELLHQEPRDRKERHAPEHVLVAHGQEPRPHAHKSSMVKHGRYRILDRKSGKGNQKHRLVREQMEAESVVQKAVSHHEEEKEERESGVEPSETTEVAHLLPRSKELETVETSF